MNTELREVKATIRTYLRTPAATDEKLAVLADAARRGDVPFASSYRCLKGRIEGPTVGAGLTDPIVDAYHMLGHIGTRIYAVSNRDLDLIRSNRVRRLLPMVLAEIGRRKRDRDRQREYVAVAHQEVAVPAEQERAVMHAKLSSAGGTEC